METVSSQSQQAQGHQATASSSTPSKKDFKTWFDEFKARVSKKSQGNQATNSDQTTTLSDDTNEDEIQASVSTASQTATSNTPVAATHLTAAANLSNKTKTSSLRARKVLPKISSNENSPDFETSSISTILNRRDSRHDATKKRRPNSICTRLFLPFKWIILYLMPFNVTLPWKLICLVNSCFVIIVVGLASNSSHSSTAFTFCNGFIGGLIVATISFLILALSFIVHVMPKTSESDKQSAPATPTYKTKTNEQTGAYWSSPTLKLQEDHPSLRGGEDVKSSSKQDNSLTDSKKHRDSGDFSLYEILDQENDLTAKEDGPTDIQDLDDVDYKGWMIEFIGDYEQRNTSEIKLKSIFVKLKGRSLYLCKPKNSSDVDATISPAIVSQRIHDLNHVERFSANLLIPKNVRNKQKYVWSKKYPIKLEFQESTNNISDMINASSGKSPSTLSEASSGGVRPVQITLFAKSCREKEEWFRRFKRIVEENRLAHGLTTSYMKSLASQKTDENTSIISNSESLFDSFRRFRRRSPSPKRNDCVQTSQSSHLLSEPKRIVDDLIGRKQASKTTSSATADRENESSPSSPGLVRTKSCELLESSSEISRPSSRTGTEDEQQDKQYSLDDIDHVAAADESTLTRETADLFSQAIGFSNFVESQPNLDYKSYIEGIIKSSREATSTSNWFNALTGRIFFDVFSHDYWSVWFKRKIQRKLYRIRLPYFMETLTLTKIDLGTNAPQFLNVNSHSFDSYGLSIDFDMAYCGGLTMTFETKLNLLKIKSDNSTSKGDGSSQMNALNNSLNSEMSCNQSTSGLADNSFNASATCLEKPPSSSATPDLHLGKQASVSASSESNFLDNPVRDSQHLNVGGPKPQISSSSASIRTSNGSSTSDSEDSDSDSSSDSSFEEGDANEISDWEDYGAEKTRQNIVRFVDKIASSRYFQHATENRYIKKKLQDISNCPLVLVVQIQSLNGVLTLNVPPPQTDRIWYGFKPNPELVLKALPKMGDREVSLSHVTDWIERKLAEEFRKILVIPNMEDIVLPVLKSDHLQYVTATK